eukprot:354616-Chlamydomonas_euryale.AAC.1
MQPCLVVAIAAAMLRDCCITPSCCTVDASQRLRASAAGHSVADRATGSIADSAAPPWWCPRNCRIQHGHCLIQELLAAAGALRMNISRRTWIHYMQISV